MISFRNLSWLLTIYSSFQVSFELFMHDSWFFFWCSVSFDCFCSVGLLKNSVLPFFLNEFSISFFFVNIWVREWCASKKVKVLKMFGEEASTAKAFEKSYLVLQIQRVSFHNVPNYMQNAATVGETRSSICSLCSTCSKEKYSVKTFEKKHFAEHLLRLKQNAGVMDMM